MAKVKHIVYEGKIKVFETKVWDHRDNVHGPYVVTEKIDVCDFRRLPSWLTSQLWELWTEEGTKVRVTIEVLDE